MGRIGVEVNIDGIAITSATHLTRSLEGKDRVTMSVVNVRNGQTVTVNAFPQNGKLGIDMEIVDLNDPPPFFYSKKK